MLTFIKTLLAPPAPAIAAAKALDQMASEATRARQIRQAGLEAVRKALEN